MPGRITSREIEFPARFPADPDLPGVRKGFRNFILGLKPRVLGEPLLPLFPSTFGRIGFQIGAAH
jgi:hypothetical protein